jgi:hypothetical protein
MPLPETYGMPPFMSLLNERCRDCGSYEKQKLLGALRWHCKRHGMTIQSQYRCADWHARGTLF